MRIEDIEKDFEQDPNVAIQKIYRLYRSSFIKYSNKYTSNKENIIDCFQESIITLYENVVLGRIDKKETLVKTYLYAVGKNKLLKQRDKQEKMTTVEYHANSLSILSQDDKQVFEEHKEKLQKAFVKLGAQCREIIIAFYYQQLSIQEIVDQLDYKNANTVKANKSRCMAKLRTIAKEA